MEVNILVDELIPAPPDADWLRSVAVRVLTDRGTSAALEMGLVITGQEQVRELNRTYREQDENTDVLAFSAVEENGAGSPPFIPPPDGIRHLGEVIISYPQAVIQAEERHHPVEREVAVLVIHGVLHLLGYDHDTPERESQMRAIEAGILNNIEVNRDAAD